MMPTLKHKFKAVQSEANGIIFSSKKEMRRYLDLNLLKKAGQVLFFIRQVPFHLPGNIKYVCDFMIFWTDGNITIEDVKGFKTDMYKAKKRIVEAVYPIEIQEV